MVRNKYKGLDGAEKLNIIQRKIQYNNNNNKKTLLVFLQIWKAVSNRIKGITCQDAAECSLHINGLQSRGLHKQKLVFF